MKIVFIAVLFFTVTVGSAQVNPGEQLSGRIAQRMKDSLLLTTPQQESIYTINMQLHSQKMALRQQHLSADTLRLQFQKIENGRDSLYRQILSPDQFLLYKQKKRNLVNGN